MLIFRSRALFINFVRGPFKNVEDFHHQLARLPAASAFSHNLTPLTSLLSGQYADTRLFDPNASIRDYVDAVLHARFDVRRFGAIEHVGGFHPRKVGEARKMLEHISSNTGYYISALPQGQSDSMHPTFQSLRLKGASQYFLNPVFKFEKAGIPEKYLKDHLFCIHDHETAAAIFTESETLLPGPVGVEDIAFHRTSLQQIIHGIHQFCQRPNLHRPFKEHLWFNQFFQRPLLYLGRSVTTTNPKFRPRNYSIDTLLALDEFYEMHGKTPIELGKRPLILAEAEYLVKLIQTNDFINTRDPNVLFSVRGIDIDNNGNTKTEDFMRIIEELIKGYQMAQTK